MFLDFEGDPFVPGAGGGAAGLEYLLGYACRDGDGPPSYAALWALDRAAEKGLLEAFVDFVMQRLQRHPDLHLYHYAPYEPAALKRLASRHALYCRALRFYRQISMLLPHHSSSLRETVDTFPVSLLGAGTTATPIHSGTGFRKPQGPMSETPETP